MTDRTSQRKHHPTLSGGDLDEFEAPVKAFFDQHANYYEKSWDLREHGLSVGIFDVLGHAADDHGHDLEAGYQRSRDHVVELLRKVHPLDGHARVLDICCGTGSTLSQIVDRYCCFGMGVDISEAQLKHAEHLRNHDRKRTAGHLLFREGSASLIDQVVGDEAPFTHAFSQEGLLFAHDKRGAIQGIFDLLLPGGALVISDFVPLASKENLDAAVRARVYEDVKWANGLSFQQYLGLLKQTGFEIVQAELRPLDMQLTYEKLIPRTASMSVGGDETYSFLARRYAGIVQAISDGALSWGWFAARKL